MKTLFPKIENYGPKGGSGTKLKSGPQDIVIASRYLERKKNQTRKYFRILAKVIKDAGSIALFGPSDTAEKFSNELRENQIKPALKITSVGKADNQVLAHENSKQTYQS